MSSNPPAFPPLALDSAFQKKWSLAPVEKPGALAGRIFDVKDWKRWPMARRLAFLDNTIRTQWARDPQLREFATQILVQEKIPAGPQHTWQQACALLKWVQKNIRYGNEPDELLQSPQYTLERVFLQKTAMADCDDMAILLGAMLWSLAIPFQLVISGRDRAGNRQWYVYSDHPQKITIRLPTGRGVEVEAGGPVPAGVTWTHIFLMAGNAPLKASWYGFCEPTLDVPAGWSVMFGGHQSGAGVPSGRNDLAGIVDHRPGSFLGATDAGTLESEALFDRLKRAFTEATTIEKVVAVAVPTLIATLVGVGVNQAIRRK